MPGAIIWGASGGIGRALVNQLHHQGWAVYAISHTTTHAEVLTQAIFTAEADTSHPADVQRVVQAVAMQADQIDLFVYAAGDITSQPVAALAPTVWQRILNANLTGAYTTVHYSLPLLSPSAPIVLLGAISERLRLPGLSAYAAAKAGLEAFADALRKEERTHPVIVVRPGAVDTAFWERVSFSKPKHIATPQQVAEKVVEAVETGHKGQLDLT